MGARITHLVLARTQALSLLHRAPRDRYVLAAIHALEDDPYPGEPGGQAREITPGRFTLMGRSVAQEIAREHGDTKKKPVLPMRLSQCAGLITLGLSNAEIGEALHLSENTVKSYVKQLFALTHARNRTHLAVLIRQDQIEVS